MSCLCGDDEIFDEEKIQEQYIQNYINVKNGVKKDLDFIKDCMTLDQCKDLQIVNIINNLNRKEVNNKNEDQESSHRKKYLVNYLKNRIISMNPLIISMLEVNENGSFNNCIEAAMEQQGFEENKEYMDGSFQEL